VPDIVDAIVDLTETGSSLRIERAAHPGHGCSPDYTELIASKQAYEDPAKRAAMEDIALLLRGAESGPRQRAVKLQRPGRPACRRSTEMLPAMCSPTITATGQRKHETRSQTVVAQARASTR